MKENKHFTLLSFSIPLIYVSVVGIFFHDNLPVVIHSNFVKFLFQFCLNLNSCFNKPKIMNRQQTDELKGFMQFVILIYRMSNAQKVTGLYFFIQSFN